MPAVWSPLVAAPAAALLLLTYASRPRTAGTAERRPDQGDVVGPVRLAVVRAALGTGLFAVLSVELLGARGDLTALPVAVGWLVFLAVAVGLAVRRRRRHPWTPSPLRLRDRWRSYGRGDRFMIATIGVLLLAELVVALLAPPNNYDSQTYHLPKVEHWVAQGSLDFWPTAIHRQVTIPPGAEYLLLHLRLLTGGDALYNLVQWAAGIGCVLVASRIAGQLGGSRRAQLITAFLVAGTPMVALQATSTQTDLVVAAWVGCVGTLVLDGLRRVADTASVLVLGVATGLTTITKTSGMIGAGPLLALWGLAQLRLALRPPGSAGRRGRGVVRIVGQSAAVLAITALVAGPFLLRVQAEFGNPLGPPRLRDSIPMQRHDPAAVAVNLLRIGHTAFDTPLAPLRHASATAIERFATLVGVPPNDRAITFGQSTFPVPAWYPDEDRVAFPLTGALALIGAVLALARPRAITADPPATAAEAQGAEGEAGAGTAGAARGSVGVLRAYAGTVVLTVLLHAAMIKWQPWGNRLLLYALVLAVPLAGVWLDALFRRRAGTGRRSVAAGAAVAVLATAALAGVLAVSYGFPRRLVGAGSVLTTSDEDLRFLRRPQWEAEYRWAAGRVEAAGARRVGLVQGNDDWEYPWWVLLVQSDPAAHREIVPLQSVLPHRPADPPTTVDAVICTAPQRTCAALIPPGWRVDTDGVVTVALPLG
ncbi:hypothetical protein [Micromonospora zhanjiangensis]|uniref:Dolichyl-phosphate-mannose-protein mannosyltransferase n=1 Tax=Micromonospora zhanjiangensis TaxID=1522057 RepID=A0ABV8KM67_9ACTN